MNAPVAQKFLPPFPIHLESTVYKFRADLRKLELKNFKIKQEEKKNMSKAKRE